MTRLSYRSPCVNSDLWWNLYQVDIGAHVFQLWLFENRLYKVSMQIFPCVRLQCAVLFIVCVSSRTLQTVDHRRSIDFYVLRSRAKRESRLWDTLLWRFNPYTGKQCPYRFFFFNYSWWFCSCFVQIIVLYFVFNIYLIWSYSSLYSTLIWFLIRFSGYSRYYVFLNPCFSLIITIFHWLKKQYAGRSVFTSHS